MENEADAITKLPVDNYTTSWPHQGKIEFRNFYVKYRPNLPHVLKNVSLQIQPSEKVINTFKVNINLFIDWSRWKNRLWKINLIVMFIEDY